MSDSDAVDTSTAPDQTVEGVEAVSRERPGQDPREEDEANPPAAVDHLQDQAQPQQEEEVGHNVFLVSVNQAVGQIPPGLVPVITESHKYLAVKFKNRLELCLSKRKLMET